MHEQATLKLMLGSSSCRVKPCWVMQQCSRLILSPYDLWLLLIIRLSFFIHLFLVSLYPLILCGSFWEFVRLSYFSPPRFCLFFSHIISILFPIYIISRYQSPCLIPRVLVKCISPIFWFMKIVQLVFVLPV